MVQALKTDRQLSYEPKNQSANFGITKETPLSVAVPLTIHKKTRPKQQLVQRLSACRSFNKYTELMKLENQLATAVCKKITEQGGVYLPPFTVKISQSVSHKITLNLMKQLQMEQIHYTER